VDPKRWHTREDSGIRLDREGRWWHEGERIDHPKIVEAFNQGVRPDESGRFKLFFGNDWCFIEVEDAAYQVLGVASDGTLALSDRTSEPIDLKTLSLDAEGVFRCRVKKGLAAARFSRSAQAALGELLEERDGAVWLLGVRLSLEPTR
jgi:hypothetical protein